MAKYGVEPDFASDRSAIQQIIERLPVPPPEDLLEYLDNCIPAKAYGSWETYLFHDEKELLLEHNDAVPGCEMVEHGMFCIAKACDGSQYAYCVLTGQVYWLDCEDYLDPEKTIGYGGMYLSLRDFLEHVLDELESAE